MTGEILGEVIRRLGRLGGLHGDLAQSDAQLLERFARRRDESAFAALMVRHGPMVLGVCRRLLHDSQEAEDAFQASFLILARKAGGVRRQALLGGWLYGVAYRVAARLRGRAARRRERVQPGVDLDGLPAAAAACSDIQALIHEEVGRLPYKYRSAVILCHLEGRTNEEAAFLLRCPVGTVKSRLARARDLLRSRLTRRGISLADEGVATALAVPPATASPALLDATIRFAAGGAGGRISARAVALSQGVLRTMILTKVKILTVSVLALAMLAGVGRYAYLSRAAGPDDAPKPGARAADKPADADKEKDDKPAPDEAAIQGVWHVTDFEFKGKFNGKPWPDEGDLKKIKGAKWVFTAEKVVQTPVGKDAKDGPASYKLDSSKTPKEIDFTPEGTVKGKTKKGKTKEWIYSLDGDILKLCMPGPEGGPRPTELAADEGGKNILVTLKREKPDQDKPKEDKAAPAPAEGFTPAAGPRSEKEQKLLQDWCDTAKKAFEAHKQEFVAGKIVPETVFSAAQRLLTAEVQRGRSKADRVAAYEANLERAMDVVKVAREKLEAGRISNADVDDAECFRLEAEFLLEREKVRAGSASP